MKHILHRIRHISRLGHKSTSLWLGRKKNRALAIFIFISLILAFLIYSNLFVYPNTFLGGVDVSGKTTDAIKTLITTEQKTVPKIQVKDRTYTYGYDQLGVVLDPQAATHQLFAPNRKIFPLNVFSFFVALGTKRIVDPPLVFTQRFDTFIEDMVFDFSISADTISVDPITKSLLFEENSEVYRFDRESLKTLLLTHFGNYTHPIYPMLAKVTNTTINQIADMNQRISRVYSTPIMLYLDLGGTTLAVELKEEDIRKATTLTFDRDAMNAGISVNPEALNTVITRRVHESGFPIRNNLVTQNVISDFTKAISLRLGGQQVNAISTIPGAGPTTDGTLADKYIEIDIAQAKMYLFKNGKVTKSYPVSTGLDYPTPTGKFAIINKVGLGYSNIYQDWLPWWMGFSYSQELNAYFGIHEQPYRLTADGKTVSASPQAIGTPSTGGCVALAPGAAREVYAFGDIGTPVYIYN